MSAPSPGTTFTERAADAIRNRPMIAAVKHATKKHHSGRLNILGELGNPLAVRELAAQIKDHTLQNLDRYLEQLSASVRAAGGKVHFAQTADQARDAVLDIARNTNSKHIVKSKSMTSEEIGLTPFLEKAGLKTIETDLGEYIIQISGDHPSHIVAPIIHKSRKDIADLFHEKFDGPYTDDPQALTMMARGILREDFRQADMGIIGANFAIAETGTIAIVTNEGNGRYCAGRPRVVVCLMGIEKVIPRMDDLAVFLKLLAKSATGQRLTCYTNLNCGPKRPDDPDGPEEFHLVILDNGRSKILSGKYRSTLRCIRCGACLNACPVYRNVGGHTYNSVYPGPIGKLITPLLNPEGDYKDLPQSSSLCGNCLDACPVRIDIPRMLIDMRNDQLRDGKVHWAQRLAFKAWMIGMRSPLLYRFGARMAKAFMDPDAPDGFHKKLPKPVSGWTDHRDLPAMADRPFHRIWDEIKNEPNENKGQP
jgi:L-lactate dehydrogenase complex protein LldF